MSVVFVEIRTSAEGLLSRVSFRDAKGAEHYRVVRGVDTLSEDVRKAFDEAALCNE